MTEQQSTEAASWGARFEILKQRVQQLGVDLPGVSNMYNEANRTADAAVSMLGKAHKDCVKLLADVTAVTINMATNITVCNHCVATLVDSMLTGKPFLVARDEVIRAHLDRYAIPFEMMDFSVFLGLYVLLQIIRDGKVQLGFDTGMYGKAQRQIISLFGKFPFVSFGKDAAKSDVLVDDIEAGEHIVVEGDDMIEGQGANICSSFFSALKTLIPMDVPPQVFQAGIRDARDCTIYLTFLERAYAFFSTILQFVVAKINCMVSLPPGEIKEWADEVEKFDVLYRVDGGYQTLKKKLATYVDDRHKLFDLYKKGREFLQKLGAIDRNSPLIKVVTEKVATLRSIITSNAGVFVGSEGKIPPLVLLFFGKPGVGKTLLCDHFYHDLFALLDMPEYSPSCDKYSYNTLSQYHDTYNYQSVFEIQDLMQMQDKPTLLNEVVNLMKIADTSSYPMNIAECGSKGQIFFASKFVYLTSNVDPRRSTALLRSVMADPDAFLRRIDQYVEVTNERPPVEDRFDRSVYRFTTDGRTYDYESFVVHIARLYKKHHARGQAMANLTSEGSEAMIQRMKERLDGEEEFLDVDEDPEPEIDKALMGKTSEQRMFVVRCDQCCYQDNVCSACTRQLYQHPVSVGKWFRRGNRLVDSRGVLCSCHKCNGKVIAPTKTSPSKKTRFGPKMAGLFSRPVRQIAPESSGSSTESHVTEDTTVPIAGQAGEESTVSENPWKYNGPTICVRSGSKTYVVSDENSYDIDTVVNHVAGKPFSAQLNHYLETRGVEPIPFDEPLRMPTSSCGSVIEYQLALRSLQIRFVPPLGFGFVEGESECVMGNGGARHVLKVTYDPVQQVFSFDQYKPTITEHAANLLEALTDTMAKAKDRLVEVSSQFGGWLCSLANRIRAWLWKPAQDFVSKYVRILGYAVAGIAALAGALVGIMIFAKNSVINICGEGGIANISGGAPTVKRIPRRVTMKRPTKITAQAGLLESGQRVFGTVFQNIGLVTCNGMTVRCVALKNLLVMAPLHIFSKPYDKTDVKIVFPGRFAVTFKVSDVDAAICEENHSMILNLACLPALRTVRMFPSIERHLATDAQIQAFDLGVLLLVHVDCGIWKEVQMVVTDVATKKEADLLDFKKTTYEINEMVSYLCTTTSGDCGSPLFVMVGDQWKIASTHIGSREGGFGYGGRITKEWVAEVCQELLKSSSPIVAQAGYDLPEFECLDAPVSVLGSTTEAFAHQPTKTKVIHSPLWDESMECMTAPAPLRGKYESNYGMVSPLTKAFMKWDRSASRVYVSDFKDGLYYMHRYYSRERDSTKILSLEEAVFGVEGDQYLRSIDPKAGVGFPWCVRGVSRSQLINLSARTIHPDLVEACDKLVEDLKAGDIEPVIGIDMLKDERLPLEKVEQGKARIFTILPLEFNLVLKRFFGSYCAMVMKRHDRAPCKVGLSVKHESVNNLARYLGLHTESFDYLCGDISASDRVIPYEVFMGIVALVNSWYGDQYANERYILATALFSPIHVVGRDFVQTFQGMPSGCYLTAVFNSLAYTVILAQALHNIKPDLQFDCRIATFGDDNVIVVPRSEVTMQQVAEQLKKIGIEYTDPEKRAVMPSCYAAKDVVFLQRTFVQRPYWTMPMPVEKIVENSCWIMNTKDVRSWSKRVVVNELMIAACTELAQHDEETWFHFMEKFDQKLKRFGLVYDRKTYMNQYFEVDETESPVTERFMKMIIGEAGEEFVPPCAHEQQQTVLGVEPTSTTQGLVNYEDTTAKTTTTIKEVMPTHVDGAFFWGAEYCKSLERVFVLDNFTLPHTDPSFLPFKRYCPASFLLTRDYIWTRISWAKYIRFEVVVNIRVVATKFHYGALFALLRPMYLSAQAGTITESSDGGDPPTKAWNVVSFGSWDTIFSASTCLGKVISLTGNTTTELVCEWVYPYQMLETGSVSRWGFDMAALDLYQLTAALPSDLDAPEVFIMANLRNVSLHGYESGRKALPAHIEARVGLPNQTVAVTTDNNIIAQAGPAAEIAEKQSGTWERVGQSVGSLVDGAVTLVTPFLSLLDFFGLSRPRDPELPMVIAQNCLPIANAVGIDPSVSVGFDRTAVLNRVEKESKLCLIDRIAARPMYLGFKTMSNKDDVWKLSLSPLMTEYLTWSGSPARSPEAVMSPAGFIASGFTLWRSDCVFYLSVYASSMISSRIQVSLAYGFTNQAGFDSTLPSWVVEGTGDFVRCFHFPYLAAIPFSRHGYALWNVKITLVTDIVSVEATESRPITLCAWVGFPGLQVQVQGPQLIANAFYVPLPVVAGYADMPARMKRGADETLPITGEAGELVAGDQVEVSVDGKTEVAFHDELKPPMEVAKLEQPATYWLQGDIPTSIYHICKRPGFYFASDKTVSLRCDTGWPFKHQNATTKKPRYLAAGSQFFHFSHLFLYYRSSFDVITSRRREAVAPTNPPTGTFYVTELDDDFRNYTYQSALVDGDARSIHVPFRAATPFTFCNTFHQQTDTSTPLKVEPSNVLAYHSLAQNYPVTVVSSWGFTSCPADDLEFFVWRGVPAQVWALQTTIPRTVN
ncbi:hypothetical protein [Beihai sesarmid crab virus 2]|uniref:hypothetical protein n=1 Tax=Beihai sesarmid crab virus 2 TaxID=1922662 RepID=UPI00090B2410|nr:hypothetical protein [Beihai sesarmid crab virus 2]APG78013.1 hypothetical protein [Beihai sesarmid crab virus 2]